MPGANWNLDRNSLETGFDAYVWGDPNEAWERLELALHDLEQQPANTLPGTSIGDNPNIRTFRSHNMTLHIFMHAPHHIEVYDVTP